MQKRIGFSSVRLAILLFVCSCAVLLMQNVYMEADTDFFTASVSAVIGIAIVMLYFVPSIIIKKRTRLDFISFAHKTTPSVVMLTASYYAMYFVFLTASVLVIYTDLFARSLNPETNIFAVAVILLSTCAYAAYKGINILTRAALFIFVFSILAFVFIFCGNIANLDFTVNSTEFSMNYNGFMQYIPFFSGIAFIPVIFGFNSVDTKNFRTKHIVFAVIAVFAIAMIMLMFIYFALGAYGKMQPYQMFVLSKSSDIGIMNGLDSLFLSAVTSTAFVLISSLLTGTMSCIQCKSKGKFLLMFLAVILVLYICAQNFNTVKEILTNPYVIGLLNFISAVFIPAVYLLIFRRKLNV